MYQKALAVRPDDASTRSNYGQLLLDRNATGKGAAQALKVWSSILACNCRPDVPDAHEVLFFPWIPPPPLLTCTADAHESRTLSMLLLPARKWQLLGPCCAHT